MRGPGKVEEGEQTGSDTSLSVVLTVTPTHIAAHLGLDGDYKVMRIVVSGSGGQVQNKLLKQYKKWFRKLFLKNRANCFVIGGVLLIF